MNKFSSLICPDAFRYDEIWVKGESSFKINDPVWFKPTKRIGTIKKLRLATAQVEYEDTKETANIEYEYLHKVTPIEILKSG